MNNSKHMASSLRAADFNYELPEEMIARYPSDKRGQSRLLVLDRSDGELAHRHFSDLPQYLRSGDLLILNDTRVLRARLQACKPSGGAVEITIESMSADGHAQAHIKSSRPVKEGSQLRLLNQKGAPSDIELHIFGHCAEAPRMREIALATDLAWDDILDQYGELPLPPYLKRREERVDLNRYQTVFARQPGAVAASTAGLHFSEPLLREIADKGVNVSYITLHVGYGTFAPLTSEDITQHKVHAEYLDVSAEVCRGIMDCRERGNKVVAVGTTVVRALETAGAYAENQLVTPYQGATRLFIYPGYQFKVVQAMVTNFHRPNTSLLPLVAAFAGTDKIMHAYREAIAQDYRFLSYGDAMLLGDWS
jgi:S-adenosylmethionine:tRNA ribosyltransferase-isomerase